MERMTNRSEFIVFLLVVVFLPALLLSPVHGDDQLLWNVERIRFYCAWDNDHDNWNMTNWNTTGWDVDNTTGTNAGQGIVVSIIDTGMDYSIDPLTHEVIYHPDLNASLQLGGMRGFNYNGKGVDVYDQPADPPGQPNPYIYDNYPFRGHGTQVAGVIAAAINGMGIIGAAPKVAIYSLKVNSIDVNDGGHAMEEEIAAAINYSVDYLHARVVEISIQGPENNSDLQNAVNYAYYDYYYYRQGPLVIVAAGNENTTVNKYPALCNNVLVVGATNQNDTRASFSNFGPEIYFVAPGVDVNTTDVGGTYTNPLVSGTSFAVPLVSAAAAMIWASKPDRYFGSYWTNGGVWEKMWNTTAWGSPRNNDTGWGLINAWLPTQRPIGDINQDGNCTGADLIIYSRAFGSYGPGYYYPGSPPTQGWDPRADVNIDKKVDGRDGIIISRNFGAVDP